MSSPAAGAKVGLLALQGAVEPHAVALGRLGAVAVEVRTPEQLEDVDALVVPGGESTTMSKLLDSSGLRTPLGERLALGLPVLGTCAGMIVLAREVLDGRADQRSLGAIDIAVRRNAFGRQVDSFEADVAVAWPTTEPDRSDVHAVFIRAPLVEEAGPEVEVLARVGGRPVVARQGAVLVTAFHPELTDDLRVHRLFLSALAPGTPPAT